MSSNAVERTVNLTRWPHLVGIDYPGRPERATGGGGVPLPVLLLVMLTAVGQTVAGLAVQHLVLTNPCHANEKSCKRGIFCFKNLFTLSIGLFLFKEVQK